MTESVLICTVGGSHEPIVTAIRALAPGFVCFLCTGEDPATKRSGSERQITGRGVVIKAHFDDPRPTLPNIPAQLELAAEQFEVVIVPADDLDRGVALMHRAIQALRERFPDAELVADYTGGTKTMSAALVTAALDFEEKVGLHVVTGPRADLVKVRGGMEHGMPVSVQSLRLRRGIDLCLKAWERYAYDEALLGLDVLNAAPQDAHRLNRARDLSSGFAAWDRFEHEWAKELLGVYASALGRGFSEYGAELAYLTRDCEQREPLRIMDLWRNAERRATQGRYDDAVARVYRLLEWTAQWLLLTRCGIDTADIQAEQLPAGFVITPARNGKRAAGLFIAWQLIGHKLPDSAAGQFIRAHAHELEHHLRTRNHSILAHGFSPIGHSDWRAIRDWLDSHFTPVLMAETARAGIRRMPPQLPNCYGWLSDAE